MFAMDGGVVLVLSVVCAVCLWGLAKRFERSPWFAAAGLLPAMIFFSSPTVVMFGFGGLAVLLVIYGLLRLLGNRANRP